MEDLRKLLQSKVKDCKNTSSIFNTEKYILLKDAERILNKALNMRIVGVSTDQNTERPSGLKNNEWWCTNCKIIVEGSEVTFEERHDLEGCYSEVI